MARHRERPLIILAPVALQVAMLDALSGEAEEGWRQAAAADAAVAAVAKVRPLRWRCC